MELTFHPYEQPPLKPLEAGWWEEPRMKSSWWNDARDDEKYYHD